MDERVSSVVGSLLKESSSRGVGGHDGGTLDGRESGSRCRQRV